ncbi:hypothetical protein P8452_73535 [Trifolium repens]|nr:hypothetical protein P8452_73535 [Trifolium repens]
METTHSYLSVSVLLKVKLHFLELCFTNLSMVVVVIMLLSSLGSKLVKLKVNEDVYGIIKLNSKKIKNTIAFGAAKAIIGN